MESGKQTKVQHYTESGLVILGFQTYNTVTDAHIEFPPLYLMESSLYMVGAVMRTDEAKDPIEFGAAFLVRSSDRTLITDAALTDLINEILPDRPSFLNGMDDDLYMDGTLKFIDVTILEVDSYMGEWMSNPVGGK